MSINFYEQKRQKLHSPLLDIKPDSREKQNKGKRTYYNPLLENKPQDNIDETLDKTLFNNHLKLIPQEEKNIINLKAINSLETLIKIANVLVLATGGIFSFLEFVNIIRGLSSGNTEPGNSIVIFTAAFLGTVIFSVICAGFSHLIKTTKHIYLSLETQNKNIDKLVNILLKV